MRPGIALTFVVLLLPASAGAVFHLWDITEVYSNADGSVQYVELYTDSANQDELTGHFLKSTARNTNFVFPTDLDPDPQGAGNNATANHHFLIATPAFASQPGAVPPDFVFGSANFFAAVADTLDFSGWDTIAWVSGGLPTNGIDALHEDFGGMNRRVEPNSPTNFAGQVGSLPEPSAGPTLTIGAGLLLALSRRRVSRT